MTDDLYYRKLESISTTDLVDMIRERDERIEELEYAKTIIQDLLNNSDEYARERAINFLKESE